MVHVCPICEAKRSTKSGLYWHLKVDHGMDSDEAYNEAGNAGLEVNGDQFKGIVK